ncbi:hypothetical protein GCM10009753_48010 [Streptantibioticus ferralitis]
MTAPLSEHVKEAIALGPQAPAKLAAKLGLSHQLRSIESIRRMTEGTARPRRRCPGIRGVTDNQRAMTEAQRQQAKLIWDYHQMHHQVRPVDAAIGLGSHDLGVPAFCAKSRQCNDASSICQGHDGRWHGYVTVGVKDDGTPDRRHVSRKTRAEVTKRVHELERQRDSGAVRLAGQAWTVKSWLTHWVENIAALHISEGTIDGYRVAVDHHLIPGLGAHRLEKLEPEHSTYAVSVPAHDRPRPV